MTASLKKIQESGWNESSSFYFIIREDLTSRLFLMTRWSKSQGSSTFLWAVRSGKSFRLDCRWRTSRRKTLSFSTSTGGHLKRWKTCSRSRRWRTSHTSSKTAHGYSSRWRWTWIAWSNIAHGTPYLTSLRLLEVSLGFLAEYSATSWLSGTLTPCRITWYHASTKSGSESHLRTSRAESTRGQGLQIRSSRGANYPNAATISCHGYLPAAFAVKSVADRRP